MMALGFWDIGGDQGRRGRKRARQGVRRERKKGKIWKEGE
jgi:hypothetical protein